MNAALIVFILLFGLITFLGFVSGRWNKGDLNLLHEWGLGGRRFGTLMTWFMLGGDIYTAYTFIAVPALMFGAGAIGFFSVLTMMLVYPILYGIMPRLWSVARAHGYVTGADFVRGRFGNSALALAIAVTGIMAVLPYIALQLVGLEVVIAALGIHLPLIVGGLRLELPLLIAFGVLAVYTYMNGLRATAVIAIVKDVLIYGTVIAAVVIIPSQLGGYAGIFASVRPDKLLLPPMTANSFGPQLGYATLALGSAFALFLYPHSMTGVLSSSGPDVIRRNASLMPLYTLALALVSLLGFMAIAAGVTKMPEYADAFKSFGNNFAVPALFLEMFPGWFAGVALAAIGIGALVPAAIMSIAAGNLFTRNIYKEYIRPQCSPVEECQVAKFAALAAKLGGLLFILLLPTVYAVQLQLLGGIWISQTMPAVMLGLFTRWLNPWALLAGWAAGISAGTCMAVSLNFESSVYALHIMGITLPMYAAVSALLLNIAVSAILSLVFNTIGLHGTDATQSADYR
jgi:SSS family solute:Na+ symporter